MKMNKWLSLLLAGLMTASIIGVAGCDKRDEGPDKGGTTQTDPDDKQPDDKQPDDGNKDPVKEDKWNNEGIWLNAEPLVPTTPVSIPTSSTRTTNVSVHDPSIFHDPAKNGMYYAFGSHFAVATSFNLVEWEQFAKDDEDEKLFDGGIANAMPETMRLTNYSTDGWAPDVEYYNGKYYMYISVTKGMYTDTSVISRVEADKPTGPYSNETVLLESVSTEAGKSGTDKPNCIDPELFYDKEGKLWMVYGSFFGGIYIKELYNEGEKWGLPKEEGLNNWGKRLWLNTYGNVGVEGPYVFYNASTDYYYLMTSADDLFTRYNMRIARSKNPDGPYTDITGKDVAADGYGDKLAGNYKFANQTPDKRGYASLGHNSVIKDKDGRYFVICHARRQSTLTGNSVTTGHNLYVFQLYFNEEGWPVMSPNAYAGNKEKAGTVEASAVAGDYEIVIHGFDNSQNFVESETYTLAEGGTVTKGDTSVGTWTLVQNYYINLTISDVEYKGVVIPGYDMYAGHGGTLSITAVNSKGQSLWAIAK